MGDIDYSASFSNKKITINPTSNFTSGQVVYVAIIPYVTDQAFNLLSPSSSTFTAADTVAPTVTFNPTDGAIGVGNSQDIVVTFSEAVQTPDSDDLTTSNVADFIILKDTDANGADISYTASVSRSKKITINPT